MLPRTITSSDPGQISRAPNILISIQSPQNLRPPSTAIHANTRPTNVFTRRRARTESSIIIQQQPNFPTDGEKQPPAARNNVIRWSPSGVRKIDPSIARAQPRRLNDAHRNPPTQLYIPAVGERDIQKHALSYPEGRQTRRVDNLARFPSELFLASSFSTSRDFYIQPCKVLAYGVWVSLWDCRIDWVFFFFFSFLGSEYSCVGCWRR